ncbi:MAG: DUF5011 domain-containing protein [Bacilli bacterium]|nr:DUF5011 domain-containing protein [Bacilli bacterium]
MLKKILMIIYFIVIYLYWDNIYLERTSEIKIYLNSSSVTSIVLGEQYEEQKATAVYRGKNVSSKIKITNNIDNTKPGTYYVNYKIKLNNKENSIKRKVIVMDINAPEINLIGEKEITIYLNENYTEKGYTVKDNYDNDLDKNVVINSDLNINKIGEYTIIYSISDSSNNKSFITRKIKVINKKIVEKVAVLNYHFIYDSDKESCNQSICISKNNFRKHLEYLKKNNYYTLTIKEFKEWIYNEKTIPTKSILITFDDGALGTGIHNGNYLIPLLEEYKMNATLFLVTSWWDKNNYQSKYLNIESHTDNMHETNYCSNVSRGSKTLCLSKDELITDLNKSINTLGSNIAFCYPYYLYNTNLVNAVKETGFKLAFIGGNKKATKYTDKYKIPRFIIYKNTTIYDLGEILNN